MRRYGVAFLAAVIGIPPAAAAELPSRKPGLWEVKMVADNRGPGLVVQQCVDEATDQMLQSSAGPISVAACTRRDAQNVGDTVIIDSTCAVGGKPATAHAIITGSFDSSYTMTVTAKGEALQAGINMTVTGRWLGACQAGQKPGDVVMPNGVKLNVPEMQKQPQKRFPLPGDLPR